MGRQTGGMESETAYRTYRCEGVTADGGMVVRFASAVILDR